MVWDLGSRYYCDYYQSTWPSPPTIAGVNVQQNFAPNVPLSSRPGTQPDPEGTEGFILPPVTAKVINPDRRSDYKNYLIRDVHSNDVQSLNGVKTLLQEEGRGSLQALILMWGFIGAISKYGCVLIMM